LEKYLIKGFPIKSTIIKDVKKDKPVLTVIYLKIFKNEKVSTKFKRKL
jgi:hypothetical protein